MNVRWGDRAIAHLFQSDHLQIEKQNLHNRQYFDINVKLARLEKNKIPDRPHITSP